MSEQYFARDPQSSHDTRRLEVVFQGVLFQFETDAGVFSRDGLDFGSQLLLTTVLPQLSGRVLDLGCGWGPVGTIAGKLKPELDLVVTDINTRAVELARQNLARNGVAAELTAGDGLKALEGCFDWILLNPPIRAGKQTVFDMYRQSAERLREGGALAIVIRKQQGALSSRDCLAGLFDQVTLANRKKGYHIYVCRRAEHGL